MNMAEFLWVTNYYNIVWKNDEMKEKQGHVP